MNGNLLNLLALAGSLIAMIVSIFSWRAATHANRGALFERRFQVYSDAEEFIDPWVRDAKPDLEKLDILFNAWNRSHFLFEPEVTAYLRKLYVDAIKADHCSRIVAGEAPGNRAEALSKLNALTTKHAEPANLRDAFWPHLKVSDGYLSLPKWPFRIWDDFLHPKPVWSNERPAAQSDITIKRGPFSATPK